MKFSAPSVFTFDGELFECAFTVKLERGTSSPLAFKVEIRGHSAVRTGEHLFRAGSTVNIDERLLLPARVDVVIARVELLLPMVIAPNCRHLLQDSLSEWLSNF